MKFTNPVLAESYRDRAHEPLMIVLMENYLLVTTFAQAQKFHKQGYDVY